MREKIVVMFADIEGVEWERAKKLPFITPKDIELADGYFKNEDKVAHIVSAYFKRKNVGEWSVGESGKPFSPEKHFNVSHTSGAVVFVESESDVGIDVEKIRPVKNDLRRYISTDREYEGILNDENFFEIWTAKESLVKADGEGLKARANTVAALPLVGVKEYKDAKYFTRCIRFSEYVISVARKGDAPFDIEVVKERLF